MMIFNYITIVLVLISISGQSQARFARNEGSFGNTSKTETNKTTESVSSTRSPTSTALPSSTPSPSSSTTQSDSLKVINNNGNSVQLFAGSGTNFATNIASVIQDNLSKLTNRLAGQISWLNTTETVNSLWNDIRRSDLIQSPIAMTAAGLTFFGFVSMMTLYLFPSLRSASFPVNYKSQLQRIGRLGRSVEEIAVTVNKAIDSYARSEPDTCMMMALCTLGNAKQVSRKSRTIDTINTFLNFPGLDEFILSNKKWRDSHAYGRDGGDCEAINMNQKCPFNYDTWKLLLSSLSSVI